MPFCGARVTLLGKEGSMLRGWAAALNKARGLSLVALTTDDLEVTDARGGPEHGSQPAVAA
jgi:hypothetical protein